MSLYVDKQADAIIDELKRRYNNGEPLPSVEELQQMLPMLMRKWVTEMILTV